MVSPSSQFSIFIIMKLLSKHYEISFHTLFKDFVLLSLGYLLHVLCLTFFSFLLLSSGYLYTLAHAFPAHLTIHYNISVFYTQFSIGTTALIRLQRKHQTLPSSLKTFRSREEKYTWRLSCATKTSL